MLRIGVSAGSAVGAVAVVISNSLHLMLIDCFWAGLILLSTQTDIHTHTQAIPEKANALHLVRQYPRLEISTDPTRMRRKNVYLQIDKQRIKKALISVEFFFV